MNKQRYNTGLLLVGFLLVMAPLLGAPQLANGAHPTASEPGTGTTIYLPVMVKDYPPILFGRVTQAGAPASGVSIQLRYYAASIWTTIATAITDANGVYRFVNPPSLAAGQKYVAAFDNSAQSTDRLAWWITGELTNYSGASTKLGDFDIANVSLDRPAPGAQVGLPAAFHWWRRAASTTDSYAVRLYDLSDYNPLYASAYLGYSENFTMAGIPAGFSANAVYCWDVLVRAPDGGLGASRQMANIRLMPGLFGRVTQSGSAAGGISLQLRYFNGTAWSTQASTTTNGDGTYLFAGVPSLAAGQQYYVRYENVNQTADRLFLWGTASLNSYTNGSSLDLGTFDIADVPLLNPPGGATIGLPYTFQWTRRPATTGDSYLMEIYAADNFVPHWLSPLVGYAENYTLAGLPGTFALQTDYAWDVVVVSADGGSGVSRMAHVVTFTSRGASQAANVLGPWPFAEELPVRPAASVDTGR